MKNAYVIDDGIVIEGKYEKYKFTPSNGGCGFSQQIVTQAEYGELLFFKKELAEIMVENPMREKKRFVVKVKRDAWPHDCTEVIEAYSRKDALLQLGRDFEKCMDSGLHNLYEILENLGENSVEDYFEKNNIVKCSDEGYYLFVISVEELK